MSESETETEAKLRRLIYRSENPHILPRRRIAFRYKLIEFAAEVDEYKVWLEVGQALIRACNADDLVPMVSDKFVAVCPKEVFRTLGTRVSPYVRFYRWRKRTDSAIAK